MSGKRVFHYSIPVVQATGKGQFESGDDIDSGKSRIRGNELLFSKLNPRKQTICLSEFVPDNQLTVSSGEFLVLKPNSAKVSLKFSYYLFLSDFNRQRICSSVKSVTRSHERASPNEIYKLCFPIPPLNEQDEICAYLDKKVSQIEEAIANLDRSIEKFHQLKLALINDAITGKIMVTDMGNSKGVAA